MLKKFVLAQLLMLMTLIQRRTMQLSSLNKGNKVKVSIRFADVLLRTRKLGVK